VVGDPTLCVGSAEAGAGVHAPLLHAGSRLAALGADQALWPTVGRGPDHGHFTGAHTHSVLFLVLAVGAARVGVTWIDVLRHGFTGRYQGALGDRVSGVAVEAGADGLVPQGVTDGIDATDARAGVNTLVVHAGTLAWTVVVVNTLRTTG
jgi:hypothetical protein